MQTPNRPASQFARAFWLAAFAVSLATPGIARAATDLSLESAHDVNEGELRFLATPPAKAVHHHQNRMRIDAASLASGWVRLAQCHDHLDPVPRAQITFREGFVRDLKVDAASGIERAWVEGASVQLVNVAPGARLCLSAETRALKDMGSGYFTLYNGPYMRKFLDGYYPMRISIELDYPAHLLEIFDISPHAQPGFAIREAPGHVSIGALFEGELHTLVQFERRPAPPPESKPSAR